MVVTSVRQNRISPRTPEADRLPVILIPIFNDWAACAKLLADLDEVLGTHGLQARVLLVDDGSTTPPGDDLAPHFAAALLRVDVLRLRRNVGHQRALSVGLAYIEDTLACETVVVMDGDGEDAPADVPRLLARYNAEGRDKIVFAERTRRSESLLFRVFYLLYRILHRLLTGHSVRVGNFSVIPYACLKSLVVVPELWSHFAAAVFTTRLPYCSMVTTRAKRLDGRSRMNFVGLVTHGLTAISVFSEVVGVRLLLAASTLGLLSLMGIAAVVAVRLWTTLAVPGWATYTAGILLVIVLHAILGAIVFSFVILHGRNGAGFLPTRDYHFFVDQLQTVSANP